MPSFDSKNPAHIAAAVVAVIALFFVLKFIFDVAAAILSFLFWGVVIVAAVAAALYLLNKSRSGSS